MLRFKTVTANTLQSTRCARTTGQRFSDRGILTKWEYFMDALYYFYFWLPSIYLPEISVPLSWRRMLNEVNTY
jgi:hypothetical protein